MKAPAVLSSATSAELTDDMTACRQVATTSRLETNDWISGSPTLFVPVSEVDHRAFGACMRQRGYVAD